MPNMSAIMMICRKSGGGEKRKISPWYCPYSCFLKFFSLCFLIEICYGLPGNITSDLSSGRKDDKRRNVMKLVPEMPFEPVFERVDSVVHDLELRHKATFLPDGTNFDLDVSAADKIALQSLFDTPPDVFASCFLIRDYARPFRVGTAISTRRGFRGGHVNLSMVGRNATDVVEGGEEESSEQNMADSANVTVSSATENIEGQGEKGIGQVHANETSVYPPELVPVAAIHDSQSNKAYIEVNAFARLETVIGEVRVVLNGEFAEWQSKKKVPIAGYLCIPRIPGETPVLHTLNTPCLPTALNKDGEVKPPPSFIDQKEAEAAATATGENVGDDQYVVWVGSTEVGFSSKEKADKFCVKYAQKIAEDVGFSVWDASNLPNALRKIDPSLSLFAKHTRKGRASSEWTKGDKSALVLLMDWKEGDESVFPLSRQTLTPEHYKDIIMPRVEDAFRTMSRNQLRLTATVYPRVLRYTRLRSSYRGGGFPFPNLYDAAKESCEGQDLDCRRYSGKYRFSKFDFVYVIAPQQKPIQTKGLAWVGAKGAFCNGCEELSDNFQVMVCVHELGHNLGLRHASSNLLEYGNPFDWMGNYPDVTGLSFGFGYQFSLGWISEEQVIRISDASLAHLNDEYFIYPYDVSAPNDKYLGLKISLVENVRDLYISFRQTVAAPGIFIITQDKHAPDSTLVDAGCHTPSQKDASLQEGWLYVDPSGKIIVKVVEITSSYARLHVFRSDLADVSRRPKLTDGENICPRTCTDADLLVVNFGTCVELAQNGYCRGGVLQMNGQSYTIGNDLCPQACGNCDKVRSESAGTVASEGCIDRNVEINGKTCQQAADAGYCRYDTNIGHVGEALCRRSCGYCSTGSTLVNRGGQHGGNFEDPVPRKVHEGVGDESAKSNGEEEIQGKNEEEEEEEEEAEQEESEEEEHEGICEDDPVWTDRDGDGCALYKKVISSSVMTREQVCNYEPSAKAHCRASCDTCEVSNNTCADKACIVSWKKRFGVCFSCEDFPSYCSVEMFRADCPLTCGMCSPTQQSIDEENSSIIPVDVKRALVPPPSTVTKTTIEIPLKSCEDSECVDHWLKISGKCYSCPEFTEYCNVDEEFTASCPKSCKTCGPAVAECRNDFHDHTCKRYLEWDWCDLPNISRRCRATCGVCDIDGLNRRNLSTLGRNPFLALILVFISSLIL